MGTIVDAARKWGVGIEKGVKLVAMWPGR